MNLRRSLSVTLLLVLSAPFAHAQLTFTNIAGISGDASNVGFSKDGGCAFADFDRDGDLDLLVNTNTNTGAARCFLLRNNNGVFVDVTATLAPDLKTNLAERSASWGDCNNDGYPDFLVNTHDRIQVYLNNAGTGFTRILNITSMTDGMNSEGAGWLDYDNDGDLDFFVECHNFGIDLFRNDGVTPTPGFTQITINSVGPAGSGAGGLGLPEGGSNAGDYACSTDINGDGYVDLIARRSNAGTNTGVDLNTYDMFMNQGNGTFAPVTTFNEETSEANKGGVSTGDFDNDGDLDLLWTSASTDGDRAVVYQQTGINSGTFVLVANPFRLDNNAAETATDFDGCSIGDIDNDGDLDIFMTQNSGTSKLFLNNSTGPGSFAFRQAGPTWIPGAALNYGINVNADGEGCILVDHDNDGDLDLYVNVNGSGNQLWRNNYIGSPAEAAAPFQNSYIRVIPVIDRGGGITSPAINATVKLMECDGTTVGGVREVSGGDGHGTQRSPWLHFGLKNGPDRSYLLEVRFTRNGTTPVVVRKAIRPGMLAPISPGSSTLALEQTIIIRDTDASDLTACIENCTDGIDNDNDGLVDCADPDCNLNGMGYNWYFGQNAALNFEHGSGPVQISPSSLDAEEGCAALSGPTGDLMFYTNGVTVYDRQHNAMPNGTGLLGHGSGTQSGLIVADPGNANRHYVISENSLGTQAYYSVVDMTLNGGLGNVVVGLKNILIRNTAGEKIAAWPHPNGTDFWIVVVDQNNLYAYTLTATGLSGPVTSPIPSMGRTFSQMKFNPDGTMLAMANYPNSFSNYRIQLLDFNKNTGVFSNLREWTLNEPYGIEFSPNGRFLYATNMGWATVPGQLVQYDLLGNTTAAAIVASRVTLLSGSYLHAALQAGPDGKIYMATSVTGNAPRNGLAVINSPNLLGMAANAVADQITFTGTARSRSGLPNFPAYQLRSKPMASFVVPGDTCLPTAQLRVFATGAVSYQWLLNGSPIAGATSNTYTPTGIGSYSAIAYYACGSDVSNAVVLSDTPPTISCPANITVNVDPGICGAVVSYTTPVGTDDCPGATTARIAGQASGTTFPQGTTLVTYRVTDAAGQQASCSFNITVTPDNDNDGDGICDSGDLDDDNDGIPDLAEGGDLLDSDGDGIPNRFDLDSDNDGIYDLVEARHTAPDANNDGIIDGAPAVFGSNGLFNGLETAVDNGILNYTIRDSDSDGNIDSIELDSDGDGCTDVIEAGYTDANGDGRLGPAPLTVNAAGIVTSGDN